MGKLNFPLHFSEKKSRSLSSQFLNKGLDTGKRILGLDIIRAFAILCVLFSHTGRELIHHELWPKITYSMGVIGVELFFVLSGFLIGQILIDSFTKEESWSSSQIKRFWIRRWLRTLPNYYLTLVLYLVYFGMIQGDVSVLKWTNWFPYLFFMQNFFSPHPSFFIIAWSLSIEEWFYLFFPFVLLLLQENFPKHKNKIILTAFLIFIVGCTALRLLFAWNSGFAWDDTYRKLVPLRLDSIVIGVLAAYLYKRYPMQWQKLKGYCCVTGIGLLVFLSFIFYKDYVATGEAGFFIKTFFLNFLSLSIALSLPLFSSPVISLPGFVSRMITFTSLISYSMYLNQQLIIDNIYKLYLTHPMPDIILFLLNWTAVFIGSTIQYYYVERPILKLRDRITLPSV